MALFLASTQLPKLFGIHGAHGDFWENSGHFLKHLSETNPASLAIGGIALAVLILGKIFLKHKPVALFVVVGGIVASALLGLDARGVLPPGFPYVIFGRGTYHAWSPTAGGSDNTDVRVELLCEVNGSPPTLGSMAYRFNGACVSMSVRTDRWCAGEWACLPLL